MPIRFEPPSPPVPVTEKRLQAVADSLRRRPGEWALLGAHPGTPAASRTWAWSISNGDTRLPGRAFGSGFRAQSRTLCGERRIYACYTPAATDE